MEWMIAVAVSCVLMWGLIPLSWRLGWVDKPTGGRKDHALPTPTVGGLAIAIGAASALLMVGSDGGDARALWSLGAAGLLMLVVGMLDDQHDLHWSWRLGAQFMAALILLYAGGLEAQRFGELFGLSVESIGWVGVPFTVFMVMALINALNMIDGIDGLAGTTMAVTMAMFAAAAYYAGDAALAGVMLACSGAISGFLWFNLRRPGRPRALAFLGNGGSALLGVLLAWASLRLSQSPQHPVTATLLPWLAVPPVVDALALVIRRTLHGQSPFAADRNHLHHMLLDAGCSVSRVVLVCAVLTLLPGALAAIALQQGWVGHGGLLVGFVLLSIAYFALTYRRDRAVALFRRWLAPAPDVAVVDAADEALAVRRSD